MSAPGPWKRGGLRRAIASERARHLALGVGLFAGLSCALVFALGSDLRPGPLYEFQLPHARHPSLAVTADEPVELRFDLPDPVPDRILVPVRLRKGGSPLTITLRDAGTRRLLKTQEVHDSGTASIDVGPSLRGIRRLAVRFDSSAALKLSAPRLEWAVLPPRESYRAQVTLGGVDLAERPEIPGTGPSLRLRFPWPSRLALLGWIPLPALLVWAYRDRRRHLAFLVALCLVAAATSILLWQRDYSWFYTHADADGYTRSADFIAGYLAEPETRPAAREWFREYPHSTTMLAPVLFALPIAAGVPAELAYIEFSALCGFLAVLLFLQLLRRQLGISQGVALLASVAFASHLLMLRSFARPISDVFGLLLVLATLCLLQGRLAVARRSQTLGLALLAFAHPLARPQGWGYWLFIALALLACDRGREGGRFDLRRALRTQSAVFAIPLLLLAGLYLHFDWLHNLELMFEKAKIYRPAHSLGYLGPSLVGVCQLLPLLWIRAWSEIRSRGLLLWLGWFGFVVLLLTAARAPFWMRHFLPALPAAGVLAAVGMERSSGAGRRAAYALVAASVAFNVLVTVHQVLLDGDLPSGWARYVSSP